MSLKEKLLSHKTEIKYVFDIMASYIRNEENKIRIKDFKTISTRLNEDVWLMSIYGPDNKPFDIIHPKLKFKTNTWNVRRKTNLIPWFISELPETLFLIAVSWYMKSIAYRSWISSNVHSIYYTDILAMN